MSSSTGASHPALAPRQRKVADQSSSPAPSKAVIQEWKEDHTKSIAELDKWKAAQLADIEYRRKIKEITKEDATLEKATINADYRQRKSDLNAEAAPNESKAKQYTRRGKEVEVQQKKLEAQAKQAAIAAENPNRDVYPNSWVGPKEKSQAYDRYCSSGTKYIYARMMDTVGAAAGYNHFDTQEAYEAYHTDLHKSWAFAATNYKNNMATDITKNTTRFGVVSQSGAAHKVDQKDLTRYLRHPDTHHLFDGEISYPIPVPSGQAIPGGRQSDPLKENYGVTIEWLSGYSKSSASSL